MFWKKKADEQTPEPPRGLTVKVYPPNLSDNGIRLLSGAVEHVATMSPKLGAWLVRVIGGELTRRTEELKGKPVEADFLRFDLTGWTPDELAGAVIAARAFEQWGRRSKDAGTLMLADEVFGVILAAAITTILGKGR